MSFITFEEARQIFDIKDIAGMGHKDTYVCPLPTHKHQAKPTPSFSVFWKDDTQYFKCHGVSCNGQGDVVDFVGYMSIDRYSHENREMRVEALNLMQSGEYKMKKPEPPPPPVPLPSWLASEFIPASEPVVKYAQSRGISWYQIQKYRIGSAMRIKGHDIQKGSVEQLMTIPIFHRGVLKAIKVRNISNRGIRYFSVSGSSGGLFNYDELLDIDKIRVVVKGEIASMVTERLINEKMGIGDKVVVCAPSSGESQLLDPELIALISAAQTIYIGDNDREEIREKSRLTSSRRAESIQARLVFPPPKYKDIDEFILNDMETAVEYMQEWLQPL